MPVRKHKGDMTPEERAVHEFERRVVRLARIIQHSLDRAFLMEKMPGVVEAVLGNEEDDDVGFGGEFEVIYEERWTSKKVPMSSIVVKTQRSYFHEEHLIPLFALARGMDMSGTIRAGREDNYDGDRELEFEFRPRRSDKLGMPSDAAMQEARRQIEEDE
jgi:hypothetical protein